MGGLGYLYWPKSLDTPGLSFCLLNMIVIVTNNGEKGIFVHTGGYPRNYLGNRYRFAIRDVVRMCCTELGSDTLDHPGGGVEI